MPLLSLAAAAADPPPATPIPQAAPALESRSVRSPGNADWASSLEEASRRARAEKKLVYVELEGGAGCGHCRRMQSLLYPAFDFEALLIGMVPIRTDLASDTGKALGQRYGITEAPSVLITTPDGRLVFLMLGFQSAPDFYEHVHRDLKSYREFAREVDSQDVAKLDPQQALRTGRALFERSDPEAAIPRLSRAATAKGAPADLGETALEYLAAAQLQIGQVGDSRKSIDQLIATTKDPSRKERAELFRAQIPLQEGKPAEALALYRQFEKDHPGSKHLEQVRTIVARLERMTGKR